MIYFLLSFVQYGESLNKEPYPYFVVILLSFIGITLLIDGIFFGYLLDVYLLMLGEGKVDKTSVFYTPTRILQVIIAILSIAGAVMFHLKFYYPNMLL